MRQQQSPMADRVCPIESAPLKTFPHVALSRRRPSKRLRAQTRSPLRGQSRWPGCRRRPFRQHSPECTWETQLRCYGCIHPNRRHHWILWCVSVLAERGKSTLMPLGGDIAAMGATFAATETVVRNVREKNDALNGAAGACAAGFLAGIRRALPIWYSATSMLT